MDDVEWKGVRSKEEEDRFFLGMLQLRPGERVLDAGCGRGRFLAHAAPEFPDSLWVGVDNRLRPLREARAALAGAGATASLGIADLRSLPYPDATFATVVCMETLECFSDPGGVLTELTRVLSPGGELLLQHSDWDTLVFNVSDRDLERAVVGAWVNTQMAWMEHADPTMGRRLRALGQQAGLQDLTAGVFALTETNWGPGSHGYTISEGAATLAVRSGAITEYQRERWFELLRSAQTDGTYLFGVNHYWCHGLRP